MTTSQTLPTPSANPSPVTGNTAPANAHAAHTAQAHAPTSQPPAGFRKRDTTRVPPSLRKWAKARPDANNATRPPFTRDW